MRPLYAKESCTRPVGVDAHIDPLAGRQICFALCRGDPVWSPKDLVIAIRFANHII